MRKSEFYERVYTYFGSTYGESVLIDHKLSSFDELSALQAIEQGIDLRKVWQVLCHDFDIPIDQEIMPK